MRGKVIYLTLILLFFAFINTGMCAENPAKDEAAAQVRAYVDKSEITIGEKVRYTIEIDVDNDSKAEFPAYGSGLDAFAVKDFGKDEKKIGKGRSRRSQWYLLDTYVTGSYVIPEQDVTVISKDGGKETLKSPQAFLEVKSVMGDDKEKPQLRDIKAPLMVSSGIGFIIIIIIVLMIAAGGVVLWRIYNKKSVSRTEEDPPTPQDTAYRELERIEAMDLIEKNRVKEYYYLVSLVLRRYLEDRFSIKAPEQTTEEFLEYVTRSDRLEGRLINILKEYLRHCDLVKYAKFEPGRSQAKTLIDTTRRFIGETS